jgi:hypothetical protein
MSDIAHIEKTAVSKGVRRMLGFDLETWNVIMVSFLGLGAIAAVVVGVSTAVIIKLQKQEAADSARAFATYKLEAGENIAAANARAAEADQKAAEAKLELEKFKAPRSLDRAQLERITEAMKPFSGFPFDFSIQPDGETIGLMEQIGGALKSAGLTWEPWHGRTPGMPAFLQPGVPQAGMVAFTGLMIQIDDSKTPQWGTAIAVLRDRLHAEGIDAEGRRITDGTETANAIHIYIGRKPQ